MNDEFDEFDEVMPKTEMEMERESARRKNALFYLANKILPQKLVHSMNGVCLWRAYDFCSPLYSCSLLFLFSSFFFPFCCLFWWIDITAFQIRRLWMNKQISKGEEKKNLGMLIQKKNIHNQKYVILFHFYCSKRWI